MDWQKLLSPKRLKPTAGYQDPLPGDSRNSYESDYGRIIFSPALRRMHDKTQVFPLNVDDNTHTRLTHSLEVTSLGRSLGLNIFTNEKFKNKFPTFSEEDLYRKMLVTIENICLCHDIGNPPFGHYGEECIGNYFKEYFKNNPTVLKEKPEEKKDFEKFDGNAQGFRILATLQAMQDKYGLNYTVATLSSFIKYPNLSHEIEDNDQNYKKKLGVFQSEKDKFLEIRKITELNRTRHPFTFIMEAADTICYIIMDIEDSLNKKYFTLDKVLLYLRKNGDTTVINILDDFYEEVETKLKKNEPNFEESRIVLFRIFFLKKLVQIASDNFIKNIDGIQVGTFLKELVLMDGKKCLGKVLQKFCFTHIFSSREIQSIEIKGETVLKGILAHFVPTLLNNKNDEDEYFQRARRLYCLISNNLKKSMVYETGVEENEFYKLPDYYKLRLIVDYISGMTDSFALKIYQKLQGISFE